MNDNIRRVFLVDYENTSIRGLYGISCLGNNSKVVVFCSSTIIQKAVEDVLKVYEMRGVEISTFLLIKPGKNALDFMISTYLGYEVNLSLDKEIYIISADHGFEYAMEMAKQLDPRMTISSHRNIFECLPPHLRKGRFDIEDTRGLMLEDTISPVLLLQGRTQQEDTQQEDTQQKDTQQEQPIASRQDFGQKETGNVPKTQKNTNIVHDRKTKVVDKAEAVVSKEPNKDKTKEPSKERKVPSILNVLMRKTQKQEPEKSSDKKQKVIVEVIDVEEDTRRNDPVKEEIPEASTSAKAAKTHSVQVKKEKPVKSNAEKKAQNTKQSTPRQYEALTKAKRQVLRERLMEILEGQTRIPKRLHLGIASAVTNSLNVEECLEKTKIVCGHQYDQYKDEIKRIFMEYR